MAYPDDPVASYYGGVPGVNMSVAPPVDPTVRQPVAFERPAPAAPDPAAYYGPPPPPPVASGPVPLPPVDPALAAQPMMSVPPPEPARGVPGVNMSAPPPVRQPVSFERTTPKAAARPAGGSSNPDPFGVKKAQGEYMGTYADEIDAKKREAVAQGDKAAELADKLPTIARERQEEVALARAENDEASRLMGERMNEVQKQLDDVKAKKVDPFRLMRDDGIAVASILGGVLGGLYQGINRMQKNPFLEEFNKTLDRDIAAQEAEIQNGRANATDRMNLLAQQRAALKDDQLAKSQLRNMYYEAAKDELEAQASRYDSAAVQARADQGIAALTRQQKAEQLAVAKQAQATAAAQAAAARAQREKAEAEVRKAFTETYEKNIAAGQSPAQAEGEAARMVANLFAGGAGDRPAPTGGGDPVGAVPKDQRSEALKEQADFAKAQKATKEIATAFRKYDRTGITSPRQLDAFKSEIATAVKAGAGPGMSSDEDYVRFIGPLLPNVSDSAETLQVKRDAITRKLLSGTATPILDRHSPGWRKAELDVEDVK